MYALKIKNLEEIAEVKTDSKNRISLGRKIKLAARHYRVLQDSSSGRIVLEPLAMIPLSEPWLDRSPKAKASVERGLADAKAGRLVNAPEDFSKYANRK
jgi:predicted transcriptional regulator